MRLNWNAMKWKSNSNSRRSEKSIASKYVNN
jgi:hypothetical protein